MTSPRVIIPHLDDVGCSRGSIRAFHELTRFGLVSCGSIMVPSPLFAEASALIERRPELDVGVHLTLTSESRRFRWGPVSGGSRGGGLTDESGHFWPTTAGARRHAHPEAVEIELRAQVGAALDSGIEVTHLDHHMGAAVAPEFVGGTARLAIDLGLPMLLPADVVGYLADLRMEGFDPAGYEAVRRQLTGAGLLIGGEFRMGYVHQDEPSRRVYERLIGEARPGTTFLSLHCSAPGDIEEIHPGSAAWRIAEYELFGDPGFRSWVEAQGVEVAGVREIPR